MKLFEKGSGKWLFVKSNGEIGFTSSKEKATDFPGTIPEVIGKYKLSYLRTLEAVITP